MENPTSGTCTKTAESNYRKKQSQEKQMKSVQRLNTPEQFGLTLYFSEGSIIKSFSINVRPINIG
jgi:hypothetical protein